MTDYCVALTFIKGIGPVTARHLIEKFKGVEKVFQAKSSDFPKSSKTTGELLTNKTVKEQAFKRAEEEILFAKKHNIKIHTFLDSSYPQRLNRCEDAPIVIYSLGDADLNSNYFLALVGTRNITNYGKEICNKFVLEISINQSDTTIVSGLAYGVDSCAHRAALAENMNTIGVVAHGLDTMYPAQHKGLALKIVEKGGAIITEYPSKIKPEAGNFVQRNRIIAGMCDATVVVESAAKGGALLTAAAADSYNRDVFAFPGRIDDVFSAGCNNLIRTNQAAIITSAADILNITKQKKGVVKEQTLFYSLSDDEHKIMDILHHNQMNINDLSREMKLPIQKISSMLTTLEFNGLVTSLPGNIFKEK
jgi:DNA processing protein